MGINQENETLVFELGEQKTFAIDGERFSTDRYGHLEVAGDSFLAGMFLDLDSDKVHAEMREFLLANEVQNE